jgi:hypothetical protein|tara:strand:- start:339 stop:581 length:243 start_codon:yes stop_codon:yes gene_type:complete
MTCRLNKNQIKFYDQVELSNNLKLISDKFDVDINKLKKMYFVANKENTLNKELFNDLVSTLKNETKEIKSLIHLDQSILA